MRTHRVGTITLGVVLILFGSLFLVHLAFPAISYELIFHLWPLMLVMLGIEVLLVNFKDEQHTFVYDKGAVFLLVILSLFALFMGAMDYGIQYHQLSIY